jgi:hypothetical protein
MEAETGEGGMTTEEHIAQIIMLLLCGGVLVFVYWLSRRP